MKIRAKKSLGQHFLKSISVLKKMVEVSQLQKTDLVLEIGPGRGVLTQKILETGINLLVIEKDPRMISILEHKFFKEIKNKKLKIFQGDALKLNYQKLNLKNKKFKILANLPYYITGKFLSNILSNDIQPENLVLVLQKAVVKRIVGDGKFKENLLSLSVKIYGQPKFIMSVSAKNFSPIPKVDSAILKISKISKDFFYDLEQKDIKNKITKLQNKTLEEAFFYFLKVSFSEKRKKMLKNLKNNFLIQNLKISTSEFLLFQEIFEDLKIDKNIRAEDLKLEDFKNIFKKFWEKY